MGRVAGHRGGEGEITVREFGGEAGLWTSVERVWIGRGPDEEGRTYSVASARAYADRLVLKLEGVDGPGAAAGLKGSEVRVAPEDAPELPDNVHYRAWLIGLEVHDEQGRTLGTVAGVLPTAGADLLEVTRAGEERPELLIPMAREIVLSVHEEEGRIVVRLPDGLEELNASGGGGAAPEG